MYWKLLKCSLLANDDKAPGLKVVNLARDFKQIWKVGKVGKVGREGKEDR